MRTKVLRRVGDVNVLRNGSDRRHVEVVTVKPLTTKNCHSVVEVSRGHAKSDLSRPVADDHTLGFALRGNRR
jgi:hypothetical protein